MNTTELDLYTEIIKNAFVESGAKLNKWREKFMLEVLLLYMLIPGRINFLQLGRYGSFGEQRYRQQFECKFDWLSFNCSLFHSSMGNRLAIALDPSYISKSGKSTPHIGSFWSGCAGKVKRGLEITGLGLLDLDLHTCFHLEAIQTPDSGSLQKDSKSSTDWYIEILQKRQRVLLELTPYIVADAYFSKEPFVTEVCKMGFQVISRLRNDANLRYLTKEEPSGKRGRPKKYDGKIDLKQLDESRFTIIELDNNQGRLLSAVVNSVSLKKDILLCIWQSNDRTKYKLYFSTDTKMKGKDIFDYYKTRFQIEFCFRDAKQFTGLTHSQSRSLNKLDFHFNASLTAVNIAKAKALKNNEHFSMASCKTLCYNTFLLKRFISLFGIEPNKEKNQNLWEEAIRFAAIAA